MLTPANAAQTRVTVTQILVLYSMMKEIREIEDQFAVISHWHAFFDMTDQSLGANWKTIAPVSGGGHPSYNAESSHLWDKRNVEGLPRTCTFGSEIYLYTTFLTCRWRRWLTNGSSQQICEYGKRATHRQHKMLLHPQAILWHPVRLRAGLRGYGVDASELEGSLKPNRCM